MDIGIFGGTFDPLTTGHVAVMKNAFDQWNFDKIIIVPTTVNYYRPDCHYMFNFNQKVRIIQHFITKIHQPVELDLIEKDKGGDWRTIDLVQYFKNKYPDDELYLIIGEDSYKDFKTWTRWKDILKYVTLAVANRFTSGDFKVFQDVPAVGIDMGDKYEDCSATKTRERISEEALELYLDDVEWYNEVTE